MVVTNKQKKRKKEKKPVRMTFSLNCKKAKKVISGKISEFAFNLPQDLFNS